MNFAKFLKTSFLQNTSARLLLKKTSASALMTLYMTNDNENEAENKKIRSQRLHN